MTAIGLDLLIAYRFSSGRLGKENVLYTKEAEVQKRKLDKFIADGAEDWDINNGVRFTITSS
jgi:hypothetical protein